MSQINCSRSGCRDVFHAFLVEKATYQGFLEMPEISPVDFIPERLTPFSKSISSKDYQSWVHFYEDDANFERIWNNPKKYLPILKRFAGVISPDFSLYRDMPLVMQYWNIYRSRAIGRWLQDNGLNVITNVRFGDHRTYDACCYGVPRQSTIAIGTHGCIKIKEEKRFFSEGLAQIVQRLSPKTIVVYGAVPESIFKEYIDKGINVLHYASDIALAKEKR